MSGASGLRLIKGFRDKSLRGDLTKHRSSRLNQQYRVVYRVEKDKFLVEVVEVNPHDYRKRTEMKNFRQAQKQIHISPGESVRIIRELQELSQNELSDATKIPQSTISAIERGRINLGVERAKVLARALHCHPAVLVFPGWDIKTETAA